MSWPNINVSTDLGETHTVHSTLGTLLAIKLTRLELIQLAKVNKTRRERLLTAGCRAMLGGSLGRDQLCPPLYSTCRIAARPVYYIISLLKSAKLVEVNQTR